MERQRHPQLHPPGDGKRGDTQQIGATFSGPLGERFGLRIGANSMRRDSDQSNTVSTAMPTPARRTAMSTRCCSGS
jgi:outer membrane receptor for ferrienterochelin and colicin